MCANPCTLLQVRDLRSRKKYRTMEAMHYSDLPDEAKPFLSHLFDPDNPLSLANALPGTYGTRLLGLVQGVPDLWPLISDEEQLKKTLRKEHSYQPSVNDQRLRYAFWQEFENAQLDGRKMHMPNVHSLICNEAAFTGLFMKLPFRAAFLVCRPAGYQVTIREMLLHGMERMRGVLDLDPLDSKGKPNTKLLELQLKIVAMIDMRLHGAPTQKIHQVNQNLPAPNKGALTQAKQDVKELVQKGDMASIQKRLEEINAEKRAIEGRDLTGAKAEKAAVAVEVLPARKDT